MALAVLELGLDSLCQFQVLTLHRQSDLGERVDHAVAVCLLLPARHVLLMLLYFMVDVGAVELRAGQRLQVTRGVVFASSLLLAMLNDAEWATAPSSLSSIV
jgi:hypothetical protein